MDISINVSVSVPVEREDGLRDLLATIVESTLVVGGYADAKVGTVERKRTPDESDIEEARHTLALTMNKIFDAVAREDYQEAHYAHQNKLVAERHLRRIEDIVAGR